MWNEKMCMFHVGLSGDLMTFMFGLSVVSDSVSVTPSIRGTWALDYLCH